jgi:small GTP-binding protein
MLGDAGVGKTAIVMRFQNANINTRPTVISTFSRITVRDYRRARDVELHIWDLAGYREYQSVITRDFRGADFAVLVFDLTRSQTLDSLPNWIELLENNVERKPMYVVVGNKADLESDRQVDSLSLIQYANEIEAIGGLEASALTVIGVHEILETIIAADRVSLPPALLEMKNPSRNHCCSYKTQNQGDADLL